MKKTILKTKMDELETQTMQVAKTLSSTERTRMYSLVRAFKRTQSQVILRKLEDEFGLSIDYKDYGADQNVEKGQQDY